MGRRDRWPSKLTAERGYSLVEIMIALGIAALLAAGAIPYAQKLFRVSPGGQDLETLRAAITSARDATILNGAFCATAAVNPAASTLTVTVDSRCPPPAYTPSGTFSTTVYTFSNITLSNFSNGSTLQFIPGGGTNVGAPVTMNITMNTDGSPYLLKVWPAIGNIRLTQGGAP